MSHGELSAEQERLLDESRARQSRGVDRRDLTGQLAFGLGFLACAIAVAIGLGGGRAVPAATVAVVVIAYAVASRVEFDVGAGFTMPTQLAFVPMLLLVDPAVAPLLVVAGSTLGRLPDYLTGRRHPLRALLNLSDAWYSLGPAVVLAAAAAGPPALDHWPIYAAALAAQFAVDGAASVAREWVRLGIRPPLQLGLMAPVYGIDAALAPLGLMVALPSGAQPLPVLLVLPLVAVLAGSARERRARIDQALELSSAYRRTAILLGDVVGDDDEYTGLHSEGVVAISLAIADELGLRGDDRQLVEFGALLHDVGKIRIPGEIINKPGPLTPAEWDVMRTHTILGQEMLERVGGRLLTAVGVVVRASHERWDGTGYPDGLTRDQIPVAARIVACADAISAMTTDRPYRPAMSAEVAVSELRSAAGAQFDPDVAEAAANVLGKRRLDDLTPATHRAAPAPAPMSVDDARRMVELSSELLATLRADGTFGHVNSASEQVLGRPAGELAGRALADLLHPDDAAATFGSDGRPHRETFDARCLHQDGGHRWLQWALTPCPGGWYAVARDVSERRALEQQLFVDPLTGLSNRAALLDRLTHALARLHRREGVVAVLFIDVDRFKGVNDRHGHSTGDGLLHAVGARLRQTVRLIDTVARFGGDEFVVLLEDGWSDAQLAALGERVAEAMRRPFDIGEEQIRVTASVGMAVADSADCEGERLLANADRAMYRAKGAGGDRCETFEAGEPFGPTPSGTDGDRAAAPTARGGVAPKASGLAAAALAEEERHARRRLERYRKLYEAQPPGAEMSRMRLEVRLGELEGELRAAAWRADDARRDVTAA